MDIQEELDRVLYWIAALLILLLQWLYPRVPQSHVLSRMFYDHLTLSRDLTYWVPTLFISLLHCMLWGFGLSVQMHGKPFPVWGSHNNKIQRKEGKSLWYCWIYAGKGFKNKLKMYNTVDCYDKPSNENKYPYKTSFQKPSPLGPSKNNN